MIAINDIKQDEVISRIPKQSILQPNTTEIRELISKSKIKILKKIRKLVFFN
jgi:hypothetical protein